ncbi:uncharacterized protein O3C94_008576 [Discoglossus pictus]
MESKNPLYSMISLVLFSLSVQGGEWKYIPLHENKPLNISCNVSNGDFSKWYNFSNHFYFTPVSNKCENFYEVQSHGGIFTCKTQTSCTRTDNCTAGICCDSDNIFIIPSIYDERKNNVHSHSTSILRSTFENITLYCNFTKNTSEFILFWIAVYSNGDNQCIGSVERTVETYTIKESQYCCMSEALKERIPPYNTSHRRHKGYQYLEVNNLTASDSGRYLCYIYFWESGRFQWKLASNISLQVNENKLAKNTVITSEECFTTAVSSRLNERPSIETTTPRLNSTGMYIGLGASGGVVALIVIILMFLCFVKSRGEFKKNKSWLIE